VGVSIGENVCAAGQWERWAALCTLALDWIACAGLILSVRFHIISNFA
jgi:hypothetical protein